MGFEFYMSYTLLLKPLILMCSWYMCAHHCMHYWLFEYYFPIIRTHSHTAWLLQCVVLWWRAGGIDAGQSREGTTLDLRGAELWQRSLKQEFHLLSKFKASKWKKSLIKIWTVHV